MSEDKIFKLSETAGVAQAAIQGQFKHIDPVIGLIRSMRDSGFPADALTIDCIVSGKRIILILHDDSPDEVSYQFSRMDTDPASEFEKMAYDDVTASQIFNWIKDYFS